MHVESAKLKQEAAAALQGVLGLILLALVPLGVGGTIYKAISPHGWVTQMFGHSVSAGAAVLGALGVVIALAWFSRVYSSPRRRNRNAGLFLYVFGAAGFLYALQLLSKGSL
jgi:hypothetical protein